MLFLLCEEFAQPKPFVDEVIESCPEVAKKIWGKVDVWMKSVGKAKGTAMYDAVLYAAAHGLESMPRVLTGKDLEDFCKKMKDFAEMGKGSSLEDSLKSSAVVSFRAVLSRDKERIPTSVLDWVKAGQKLDVALVEGEIDGKP